MGNWERPAAAQIHQAIQTYVSHAYGGLVPPAAVRQRIDAVRAAGESPFDSPVFERQAGEDPVRFSIRLGNCYYPHMKLVIERSPGGDGHLFHADTHDRHIQLPTASQEAGAFRQLMAQNLALAAAIEAAWEREGLPTFKQYLREDLARRKAGK